MSVASALRIQRAINARRAERGFGAMTVTTAADFLRGGSPTFARAFDRRGSLLCTIQRALDEGWTAFVARARVEAGKTVGASSLLVGGLPDACMPLPYFQAGETELPRGAVVLPDIPPHPSQIEALTLIAANRRVVLVCGRRWGTRRRLAKHAMRANCRRPTPRPKDARRSGPGAW